MSLATGRLRKLAAFVAALPDEKFDFSSAVAKSDAGGCGTVCCALKWLPAVFPDDWQWWGLSTVRRRDPNSADAGVITDATAFFCLTRAEGQRAFLPWDQSNQYESMIDEYVCNDEEDPTEELNKYRRELAGDREEAAKYGFCIDSAGPTEVATNIRRIMARAKGNVDDQK